MRPKRRRCLRSRAPQAEHDQHTGHEAGAAYAPAGGAGLTFLAVLGVLLSKSVFQIFAAYGGKQHAVAERQKSHRGQSDAFPEIAPPEDPTGDERFTTRETLAWCAAAAGVKQFDLDVAACEESHAAALWYGKAENGLLMPWFGDVWCNPPYSDIAPWVEKAWRELEMSGDGQPRELLNSISMLIPATRTEQGWFQREVEPYRDGGEERVPGVSLRTKFLAGRTAFARPGSGGVGQSGSPFGCVLLVFKRTG